MRVDEFDFELPPERIALRPVEPRDRARLLVVHADPFRMTDNLVYDLPSLLSSGDVLVVNDTKVIPARLFGHRRRGEAVAKIDVTLHKRETLNQWRCFIKPAKKLDLNEVIQFEAKDNERHTLSARLIEKGEGGEVLLEFSCQGTALDAAILEIGHMPLPPYIAAKRAEDQKDARDYQTIFAEQSGAVAAPTAGLHFTPDLLDALQKKGIEIIRITLHVGAGTFLPVKSENIDDVTTKMESLVRIFEADKDFVNVNPFLKTYLFSIKGKKTNGSNKISTSIFSRKGPSSKDVKEIFFPNESFF